MKGLIAFAAQRRLSAAVSAALALLVVSVASASAPSRDTPEIQQRIKRIEERLLPPVLVKGEQAPVVTLESQMSALHVPAVSIAVVNDGKLEWARGYGIAGPDRRPVTPGTLFQAASISKPLAALAVMQLVESGKLDLDTDINKYLQSWTLPGNELTAREPVTLRRLLTHTGGTTVPGFPGYQRGKVVPTLQQILDGEPPANTAAIRVDLTPGERWRYSGGGYTIVQQLLQDVTGRQFADLLRTRVLRPLGMRDSSFEQPLSQNKLARVALPYGEGGTPIDGGPHTYPELAAAGLWTTPSDLARYIIGVQRATQRKGVIAPATAKAMLTPSHGLTRQALGPGTGGTEGRRYFTHDGGNAGYKALFVGYFGGEQDGAVVMTNSDSGYELAAQLIRTIAKEYGWPDFAPVER